MIDFKGKENEPGLVEAFESAGIRFVSVDNVLSCSNEQAAQSMIDAFDAHAWALAQVVPAIKSERERRQLTGGFPVTLPGVGLVRFHSDAHSRSQHAGLFSAANTMLMQGATTATPITNASGQQLTWKVMDGGSVPLSVGVVLALMQAALSHEAAIHAAADAHIAAATASPDPLAYNYSAGWPE